MRVVPYISVRLVKRFFNTRYRLASWTRKNGVFKKVVDRIMFDGDDMLVLPKDKVASRVIETNIEIDDPGDTTVLPSDVVKRMLEKTDEIFIMNFCICRTSNKCKEFPADHGCVFLGKGVHKIPKEYGHIATSEEAKAYIDECGELGLVHIIGRNKLDSIWLSTGDKKDLMTICNCCPCCCLWNMTRDISDDIGSKFHRMESVTVTMDSDKCIACGSCEEICFCKAIHAKDGRFEIDAGHCRGCGRCAEGCPTEAIKVTFNEGIVDKEVERIALLLNGTGKV